MRAMDVVTSAAYAKMGGRLRERLVPKIIPMLTLIIYQERNMSTTDNAITTEVLQAFQSAWSKSTRDYAARRINSEHTLQAAVYHHLRSSLRDEYSIFTEAVIRLPDGTNEETSKSKVVVDLLVCHQEEIIAAVEIKYMPRSSPTIESVRKDVLSLSRVTNRKK